MAFTYTCQKRSIMPPFRIAWGGYNNTAGSTGGTVKTGLKRIYQFIIQEASTAVTTDRAVVNGSFPLASGDVTIVTTASTGPPLTFCGYWFAIGI
jgi:hypothetical protein